jgi:hypothetical protein
LIQHLEHSEINRQRWDQCIEKAENSLPYAYSWWLDAVSPGWEALVLDDYAAVMPLTRKRKFGIEYLCQPYFTQQLGILSGQVINDELSHSFIEAIPGKYRFADIRLNSSNLLVSGSFKCYYRTDYILSLNSPYIALSSAYHRNCRRNIQKALHAGLSVKEGPGPSAFSHFIQRNLEHKLSETPRNLYSLLQKITQACIRHQSGEILGVYKNNGELAAAGWFMYTPEKIFFIVCASTSEGKKEQAMYLLVDHVIGKNAGSGKIFDFTGSDIPGVAYFNAGFGSSKINYPAVKWNNLPWPLGWLKRL